MKNILVAAIFLFSQLGLTAEKANQIKTNTAKTAVAANKADSKSATKKTFQIEDLTFSGLLLTKEEIIHLSEEDKLVYLYSMIALSQIIEGSQHYHMDYDDKVVTAEQQNSKDGFVAKYASLFEFLFPKANAFLPIIRGVAAIGLRFAPVLEKAGAWLTTVASRGKGLVSKAATTSQASTQMAFEFTPSKDALAKMTKSVSDKAKALQNANEDALKAIKKNPNAKEALKEEVNLTNARNALNEEKEAFLKAGGTIEQFTKASQESGLKRVLMWPFRNKMNILNASAGIFSLDTLMVDSTGSGPIKKGMETLSNAWTSVENWASGTDISGPGINTPEQIKALKAGDSSRHANKTCLYGGIPSNWTEYPSGQIMCGRPAAGANDNCKQEDGDFQCPDYEIKLANGATIKKSLCIKTEKKANLTIRCAGTFKAILEAKAATMDSPETADFLKKNFGEVLTSLEARDRMKDTNNETKSIFQYCLADNVEQKEECGAIKEVLAYLKTTDVKKIYETRVQLAQVEPAAAKPVAPAANSPQGADPAADAEAAATKTKQ